MKICYACGSTETTIVRFRRKNNIKLHVYPSWYYNLDRDDNVLCKNCYNHYIASPKYRERHKEERAKRAREKYVKDPKPFIEASLRWRKKNIEDVRRYQRGWCRTKDNTKSFQMRQKVLEIVGRDKLKCGRCGCDFKTILQIHHLNGGGTQELKYAYKQPRDFYYAILTGRRQISDLALRCAMCNTLDYLESKHTGLRFRLIWE